MKNREKHKGEGMRKDIYSVGRGKERKRKKKLRKNIGKVRKEN